MNLLQPPSNVLPLYLDIETADGELVSTAWAVGDEPVLAVPNTLPFVVSDALDDPDQVVVTHTKYDLRWLAREMGVRIQCQLHDTQVMGWLVNETLDSLSLEALAQRYLGLTMDKRISGRTKPVWTCDDGTVVPWPDAPISEVLPYNKRDVEATRDLYKTFTKLLDGENLLDYFLDTEAPFTRVLLDMELAGLPIDLDAVEQIDKTFRVKHDRLERVLKVGMPDAFNVRSPQHLGKFLGMSKFTIPGRVKRDPEREIDAVLDYLAGGGTDYTADPMSAPGGTFITEKEGRLYDTGYWVVDGIGQGHAPLKTVNKKALQMNPVLMAQPWVQDYLEFRALDKLLSTYLDVFPEVAEEGRIYARFNQTGTVTGRLSSSEPNLQNIPARGPQGEQIRDLFRGDLLVGDFAQLEPRLMAHFSRDAELLRIFTNDLDIYQETANLVGCDRPTAKVLILAMGYGAGAQKVMEILTTYGIPCTLTYAKALLRKTENAYATYFQWRETTIKQAGRRGFVSTLDGRKRRILPAAAQGWRADFGRSDRQAANAVIQGSAADVVRRVMIHTGKMYPQLTLLAQVHDELVYEYDPAQYTPDLARMQKWVESFAGVGVTVPLKFEPHTGGSWKEAKA